MPNLEKSEPASEKPEDHKAFDIGDALFNRWFLGGVYKGQYPQVLTDILQKYLPVDYEKDMEIVSRPLDWVGINYYIRAASMPGTPIAPAFPMRQVKGNLPKPTTWAGKSTPRA